MAEPTDAELWRGVEHTVRNVLLPTITDDWARAAAINLVGLARYAATRQDPRARIAANTAELIATVQRLATNSHVKPQGSAVSLSKDGIFEAVGLILASAVEDDGPDGDEIRRVLRPVVVGQLDDELAATGSLVPYFRGQIDA